MADPVIAPSIYSGANPFALNTSGNTYTPAYQVFLQNQQQQQNQQTNTNGSPINPFNAVRTGINQFGSGITSSINNFGTSLGFGFGGPAGTGSLASESISPGLFAADSTLANPVAAGAASSTTGSLTGASLGGTLGAAGLGFAGGGLLANLLGENQTGGSIGGGLGAGIGFAVGGPIGALIGGVGGSIFGGMFGNNSPPTNADSFYGSVSDLSSGTLNETSKNAGPVAGYSSSVAPGLSSLLTNASSSLGFTLNPNLVVGGGISTKHPGPGGPARIYVDSKVNGVNTTLGGTESNFYNPSDASSVQNANLNILKAAAQASGYSDMDALTNWYKTTGGNPAAPNSGNIKIAPAQTPAQPDPFDTFLKQYNQQQLQNAAS